MSESVEIKRNIERGFEETLEAQSMAFAASQRGLLQWMLVGIPDEDEPRESLRARLQRVARYTEFACRCRRTTRREMDFALGLARQYGLPAAKIEEHQEISDIVEAEHAQWDWEELLGSSFNKARDLWELDKLGRQVRDAIRALDSLDIDLTDLPSVVSAISDRKILTQMRGLPKARIVFVPPLSLVDMFRKMHAHSKHTGVKVVLGKEIRGNPFYNEAAPTWQVFCVIEGTPMKTYREQLVDNVIAYNKFIGSHETPNRIRHFMNILFRIANTTRNDCRFLLDEFQGRLQAVEAPRLYAARMMHQLNGNLPTTDQGFILNPTALKSGNDENILLGAYLNDKHSEEIAVVHRSGTVRVKNPQLLWSMKLG